MKDVNTEDLVTMFYNGGKISRAAILAELGRRFFEGDSNPDVPNQLLSIFTGRLNSTLLAEGVEDVDQQKKLVCEVQENCFAFLWASRKRLNRTAIQVLDMVEANPPHPRFFEVVIDKMMASDMKAAADEIRQRHPSGTGGVAKAHYDLPFPHEKYPEPIRPD